MNKRPKGSAAGGEINARKTRKMLDKCRKHNLDKKIEALKAYSKYIIPQCIKCKIQDPRVLVLHHANGGGSQHRREIFGNPSIAGSRFYTWLKTNHYPKLALEVLCSNCHIIHKYELPTSYTNVSA